MLLHENDDGLNIEIENVRLCYCVMMMMVMRGEEKQL